MRQNNIIIETGSLAQESQITNEQLSIKQSKQTSPYPISEYALKAHNKLMPDGRIFGGYDTNGRYYAVTISPFFSEFDTQIEKGILPVVSALREKGYLTCSSCYGHPKRAMVVICFPTENERTSFANEIISHSIPTLELEFKSTMVNVTAELDRNGNVSFQGTSEFDPTLETHKRAEVKYFNDVFFKSNENYYFLQINLLNDYHFFLKPILAYKTMKYMGKKDMLINSLRSVILSKNVPFI